MRRILALLTVALVTSMVAAGASAHAAAPQHLWVPIDETFTFDDCGFLVEEHDAITLHFISWFDSAGVRQRQVLVAPNAKITYTNPATGASVTTANPFVVRKALNADGSETIAFSGLVFTMGRPGARYVDSGREVIVFGGDAIETISSVGPSDDLCAALQATIG